MAKMSKEQRRKLSEKAKAQWAARKAAQEVANAFEQSTGIPVPFSDQMVASDPSGHVEPEAPALDPKEQVQCVFCGIYFERGLMATHQLYKHKGEMPTEEPDLPASAHELPPGAVVRSAAVAGQRGIPMKVKWSKRWLEQGWECDDPGCRDPEKAGWRVIHDGDDVPTCKRCHGPMHKLSRKVEWDAPPNAPHVVVWNGLEYWITPDAVNVLPDVIVGQARQTLEDDRRNRMPLIDLSPGGEYKAGRLRSVGLLEPLEQEGTTQVEA